MTKQQFHNQAHYYSAILIAFSLPFGKLTPVFIALMLINWIIEGDFKNKFKSIFKNKFSLLFIAFYLLHVIGLLYTQNLSAGLFDLQVKLSLFIFPLMLTGKPFDTETTKAIIFSFVIGCISTSLIIVLVAIHKSMFVSFNLNNFFYSRFSYFMHPSYISMYINFSIAWLLLNILKDNFTSKHFSNFHAMVAVVFLSVIIVLLSSKLGLITIIFIYLITLLYIIFALKKIVLGAVFTLLLALFFIFMLNYSLPVTSRIETAIHAISKSSNSTLAETEKESTAVRILIWQASNSVIKNNFLFGVGTGDSKEALVEEYTKRNLKGALEKKLNAHNEFYQVAISLGIIGLLLLVANLVIPLIFSIKTTNYIYLSFLLIIIVNFIPESMLSTQAGVMFYAFFNSLLCFQKKTTVK